MADVQLAERSDASDRNGLRDKREVRAIEPSAPGSVTDSTSLQAIAKHRPVRRALPNAFGDILPDRLSQVSAQR
jgi:hypothetical protein